MSLLIDCRSETNLVHQTDQNPFGLAETMLDQQTEVDEMVLELQPFNIRPVKNETEGASRIRGRPLNRVIGQREYDYPEGKDRGLHHSSTPRRSEC
ncbi:hypothetical protein AVEN_195977-1 [Araneus ventricosus]|uniref:Uncharacterized protein n=1 Tax=Araneus ventricosus TaxID=182803 RepID=A0A4Y2VZP2_ARAVE|nr:hypothetical protein AVEN_195977-1 [Araneus ventricosus]